MDDRPISTNNPPQLLMLSDCLPDPVGSIGQSRAWQLLRMAGRSHQVRLICMLDRPGNLTHWRKVRAQVEHLTIETGTFHHRIGGHLLGVISKTAADRIRLRAPFTDARAAGLTSGPCDTLLCTNPAFWARVRDLPAAVRICDFAQHRTPDHPGINGEHWDVVITDRPDTLGVSDDTEGRRIVLPRAVDIDYLTTALWAQKTVGRSAAEPLVVLHADWTQPASTSFQRWFTQKVWPGVRRAVGHARLISTRPPLTADPVATLCGATLVIPCTAEAGLSAQTSLLQAMAAQCPTVTGSQSALAVGARDGEHTLTAESVQGWIDACTMVLSNPQVQARLARAAAAFVKVRAKSHATSLSFDTVLEAQGMPESHLARAA